MIYETDLSKQRFPGIAKATLEMAYDNGGVNRHRRESDVLASLDRVLNDGASVAFDLPAINEWLAGLDDDQLVTVVAGEQSESEQVLDAAPPGTDMLLNSIFEQAA